MTHGFRRVVTVGAAAIGVAALLGVGSLVQPEAAPFAPARVPLAGRTNQICPVAAATETEGIKPTTTVTAVTLRQAPGREGRLVGAPIDSAEPALTVVEQGKGVQVSPVTVPLVLEAEGVMATGTSGASLTTTSQGVEAGLSAAPCLAPVTQSWFTGLAVGENDRTEIVLSNPDDAQAEVDLRYYGPQGRLVVPGSPGIVIEAHATRTVSLATVVLTGGPFAVQIQATEGRVAAAARRVRTDDLKPAGVEWQAPAAAPALSTLIPSVPDGPGTRQLSITNPGTERAAVAVQVLGIQGPLAPSGAEQVDVAPESTVTVDLAPGLAQESAGVQLISDRPVTGAVVSGSQRSGASADLAIASAAPPIVRTGVSAVATTTNAQAELVVSNGGDDDAAGSFEVVSLAGVVLRSEEILVAARSTATRRLTSTTPSYLVLRMPDGAAVVGGVVLIQPDGDVAGLTSVPLTSPDVAGRAPRTVFDPSVGR